MILSKNVLSSFKISLSPIRLKGFISSAGTPSIIVDQDFQRLIVYDFPVWYQERPEKLILLHQDLYLVVLVVSWYVRLEYEEVIAPD